MRPESVETGGRRRPVIAGETLLAASRHGRDDAGLRVDFANPVIRRVCNKDIAFGVDRDAPRENRGRCGRQAIVQERAAARDGRDLARRQRRKRGRRNQDGPLRDSAGGAAP